MESAEVVRASIAIASLGDLRPHEATSPDGESTVAGLLERARVLSWPLVVDRCYPERLWQFADHRIPQRLFADEAGRRMYTDALARATLEVASSSREPCQS